MTNKAKIDDSLCPLCQQNNRCEVSSPQGCWCMNTQVPEALLAQVPEHLKGISCVCNNCITSHHKQQTIDASQ